MENNYRNQGYTVELKRGETEVEIYPNFIETRFNTKLSLTKGTNSQEYKDFYIRQNSNLFQILEIADDIISWEEAFGEAVPVGYMINDPDIKIENHLRGSGVNSNSMIYIIKHRKTGEEFRFASRSYESTPGLV